MARPGSERGFETDFSCECWLVSVGGREHQISQRWGQHNGQVMDLVG